MVGDFVAAVRFVAEVGEAGDALGQYPRVTMGDGYVDLKLLSDDAVYRDDEGAKHRRMGEPQRQAGRSGLRVRPWSPLCASATRRRR